MAMAEPSVRPVPLSFKKVTPSTQNPYLYLFMSNKVDFFNKYRLDNELFTFCLLMGDNTSFAQISILKWRKTQNLHKKNSQYFEMFVKFLLLAFLFRYKTCPTRQYGSFICQMCVNGFHKLLWSFCGLYLYLSEVNVNVVTPL